jgi:hypothetical protein
MTTGGPAAPDAPSPFDLDTPGMGVYRWGSLMPVFSPLSPARAQDYPRTLAGFMAGGMTWQTPAEFRAWVCLTHELTHYIQDLTTGVGHWDHVARDEGFLGLLGRARFHAGPWATLPIGAQDPLGIDTRDPDPEARGLLESLRERLLFLQGAAVPDRRRAALAEGAAPMLAPGGSADVYRIESLLEGEAAAVSLCQVLEVQSATAEQWEVINENASVWLPTSMPDEYVDLLTDVIAAMEHMYGESFAELGQAERDAFLILSARFMCLLVDLACAHPSAERLAREGARKSDYEPGLRYLRMLFAMGAMDERRFGELLTAMREDFERAEALLVERCGYAYLPVRTIYEDWAQRLDAMVEKNPNDEIAKLRAECCRIRLEHPDAWKDKSLWSLFKHEMPFYVLGPDGLTSMGQRWAHLEGRAMTEIYAELMWNGVRLGLHDLFYETGRFGCPLGRARTCDAAIDACRTGLRVTSQYPPAPDCRVRHFLEVNGFYLGGDR